MKCVNGHELTLSCWGSSFDDYYCEVCNKYYWTAPHEGLHDYDEEDPCSCGFHDWKAVFTDEEDGCYECIRCGIIDC